MPLLQLRGDIALAFFEVLDEIEGLLRNNDGQSSLAVVESYSLMECRDAVLDAWIAYQSRLLEEYHEILAGSSTTNNNGNKKDASAMTKNQLQRLKQLRAQIFEAAQKAHDSLEQTIPFLSRSAMAMYAGRMASEKSKNRTEEFDVDDPSMIVLGSSASLPPSLSSSKQKQQSKQSPQVMLHKCNSVLAAWAKASQVSTTRLGIPQRATYLLQRMEASHHYPSGGGGGVAGTGVQATTKSYNSVLEAWAWSCEHLRATMAEQIFQTMLRQSKKASKRRRSSGGGDSEASTNISWARPNGESYRWIIQAWCHSRQRKSAFTATGHLMRYLRRLEKGFEDIEPTLDTYHMVLKAWKTAE